MKVVSSLIPLVQGNRSQSKGDRVGTVEPKKKLVNSILQTALQGSDLRKVQRKKPCPRLG